MALNEIEDMDDFRHLNEDSAAQLKEKYPPIFIEEAAEPAFQYDVNGPRLVIEKIENENFKSYAGIRVLGPFHKNFTCIIGPNGSGKSNVIDSMLFVFGFRASKIRSKKLSVLIHNSEYFPNVQSCTVKVYFQTIIPKSNNDDLFDVVHGSEFVVSRTAYKDNSSVVKINDKKISNKDAADYLKKKGIDLDHNRFLILQGEVEQISLMKPKAITEYEDGLLEYLEDIIGSHRFKGPLDILQKRFEELCDLRTEKLSRVKAVEREKKDLEDVRNDAVKYLKLCNEIVIRKNIIFQLKLQDYLNLMKSAQNDHQGVVAELESIISQIEKLNELRFVKQKEIKETIQKHMMKNNEFTKQKEDFKKLEIEDASLRDKRKHCKTLIDKLESKMKDSESKLEMNRNVPAESVERIKELTKETESLNSMKKKESDLLSKEKLKLGTETQVLTNERDQMNEAVINEESKLSIQEANIFKQKCEFDLMNQNYQKEEDKLKTIESELKATLEKLKESQKLVPESAEEIPKVKEDYKETCAELEASKLKANQLKSEIQTINQDLQDSSSVESGNRTVKFLLDQQNMGKVSGIIGRLGDLASIDPRYDVAISTACSRLDFIVTQHMDDAQKCVELMKMHNISRSAFAALDKLTRFENLANQKFTAPPQSHRLFDLVKIDQPQYRSVFYFALRDTLVVENVNQARNINKNRKDSFRIVTLQGELIESSGAMTGGGNCAIQGKIRTSDQQRPTVTAEEMASRVQRNRQLEERLKQIQPEQRTILGRISQLEIHRDSLKRSLDEKEQQYIRHEQALKNLIPRENKLLQDQKDAKERLNKLKPNDAKTLEMENQLVTSKKKFEKDSGKLQGLKANVEKLTNEIEKMGMARLGCIETRLKGIVDKLKEKEKTLKKITLSVKTAEKTVEETTVSLEKDKKIKEANSNELTDIDKKLVVLDEVAKETLDAFNKTNAEVKELIDLKEQQEKEMNESNEELKNLNQMKIQLNRNVKDKEDILKKYKYHVKQTEDIIRGLQLHIIPDDCKDGDDSFMELVGAAGQQVYSSQKDSYATNNSKQLKTYNDTELAHLKMQNVGYQGLEAELERQRPNLAAIEEYRLKEEIYMQRAAELGIVTEIRDSQKSEMDKLKRQRFAEFSAGFNLITGKLKEMYQMITMGGDAELEFVDSLDPFSEGIVFSVRPPKKSWKNISNLSGGEKTLSSLALVFALHHFKPTPFYVMDEIDAALDFKNVSIVANYIQKRTRNAQFIIISLRSNMYELADRLVCIYKPYNFSKTLVVDPSKLANCLRSTATLPPPPLVEPEPNSLPQ